MTSRLGAAVFAGLLLSIPQVTFSQGYAEYGGGSSTLRGSFDPSAPPVPPRIPQAAGGTIAVPRLPVVSDVEYQRRKSVPARLPNGLAPGSSWFSPSGDPINVPTRLPLQLTPSVSFEGIQQTQYVPPSPDIAAGPADVIQVVNATIARYSKAGQQTAQTDLSQWFGTLMPTVCASVTNCILGDVGIQYDQMHGRFILTLQALDRTAVTSYLLISVSKGATYDSGWTNWALNERLDGTTNTDNWADFVQAGFDNVAFYVTSNQFGFATFAFQYAKVRIIKKSDLYNTGTAALPYQDIFNLKNGDGSTASTLQVPHLRGRTGVGTSTGIMINASDMVNATYFTLWQVNNPAGNNPTVTRVTLTNLWPYTYPAAAPQSGTTVALDTGPSSFFRTVMRDGLLYGAQNVGHPDEPTTVTYSLVDVIHNKVTLQQRWTNGNFFYPAFDVPASIGPGNTLPNNLLVGSTTSATGSLTFAGITNIKAGEDAYDVLTGGSASRWGDYFNAAIDPVSGGLWLSGEYAKPRVSGAARWGTWNAFLPWATSQEFGDVDSTSLDYDFINVMRLWGITKGCSLGAPMFCPKAPVSRAALSVFLIRSIFGDDFPYTTTPYFADVPATDENFSYIQKMMDLGITKGCAVSPAKFCPNDIATRETAAVFITRAKLKPLFGEDFTYPAMPYFSDVPATASDFNFIQKFRELGMTNGCSVIPANFCPDTQLTREMTAAFIVRALLN